MNGLGHKLKAARSQAGLTQKDVEAKLGLRELTLKDYETERIKLPAAMGVTLAKLYGISVDQLLGGAGAKDGVAPQELRLSEVGTFFSPSEISLIYLDPVIRAYLEDHREQLFERSTFDLLTLALAPKKRVAVAQEMLRVLASLMGVDEKVTDEELAFLRRLAEHFGLEAKGIVKMAPARRLPDPEIFQQRLELRHFMLWLLFFIAKSDGAIGAPEIAFIEECAEALRINRSNYLFVKKFFVKEKF